MSRRLELRIVATDDDGTQEVIEGLNLDVDPENPHLIAEWGSSCPEFRDDRDPIGLLPGDASRGRTYFTLHIVAPMIADGADKFCVIRRTSPGVPENA